MTTAALRALAALCLLVLGCGESSSKEARVCDHATKLCGIPDQAAECRRELAAAGADDIDRKTFDTFLDCALESTTCGEVTGCLAGGLEIEFQRQLDGAEKGRDRMKKRLDRPERRDRRPSSDDAPLPTECKRIATVCGPNETLVAKRCTDMVGNLRSDPPHLAELVTCFEAANNCYAFGDCIDEMWFELN